MLFDIVSYIVCSAVSKYMTIVPYIASPTLISHEDEVKQFNTSSPLVHVEVALEDALLHSVGDLGLLGHLANGWLHDGDALCALMGLARAVERVCAGHGRALGTVAEVLCEIVSFACV
jgi:hypothetical protein